MEQYRLLQTLLPISSPLPLKAGPSWILRASSSSFMNMYKDGDYATHLGSLLWCLNGVS